MAGEGRRFKEIDIAMPKHMIEVKGKTLFEWSMLSLKNFFDKNFIFISRKSHDSNDFIKEKCRSLWIKSFRVKEIDHLTKGQAETALAVEEEITDPEDEIIIYNIDTYVEPDQLRPEDIKGDGWIPAFKVEGDRWSFVKFDNDLKVTEITEKKRISEFGTIGLYYFQSFKLYKTCYTSYKFGGYKEEYIAPLYNVIIQKANLNLYTHIIDEDSVHVLGTPEDILNFSLNPYNYNR